LARELIRREKKHEETGSHTRNHVYAKIKTKKSDRREKRERKNMIR